jgi:hypothetical protein
MDFSATALVIGATIIYQKPIGNILTNLAQKVGHPIRRKGMKLMKRRCFIPKQSREDPSSGFF